MIINKRVYVFFAGSYLDRLFNVVGQIARSAGVDRVVDNCINLRYYFREFVPCLFAEERHLQALFNCDICHCH